MSDKATLIALVDSTLQDGGMNTAAELRTALIDIINSNVNIDEATLQAMVGALNYPNQRFKQSVYRSLTNQIPGADLTPQNIVFEVAGTSIPEVTVNPDGSFIFNLTGQVEGSVLLTVGRGAAGQQESVWFWLEELVSTGPDVWAPGTSSVTRATTNSAVDSTIFPFTILSVSPGASYRVRMEVEDASEQVGLFTEPAAGNHPEVPSAVLSLNVTEA